MHPANANSDQTTLAEVLETEVLECARCWKQEVAAGCLAVDPIEAVESAAGCLNSDLTGDPTGELDSI